MGSLQPPPLRLDPNAVLRNHCSLPLPALTSPPAQQTPAPPKPWTPTLHCELYQLNFQPWSRESQTPNPTPPSPGAVSCAKEGRLGFFRIITSGPEVALQLLGFYALKNAGLLAFGPPGPEDGKGFGGGGGA